MTLKIFSDGGARGNPGPAAASFVAQNDAGNILGKCGKYLGNNITNNVAEYHGVILGLKWLLSQPAIIGGRSLVINFYLDSELVMKQLTGQYRVKDSKMKILIVEVKNLEIKLKFPVKYQLVPRHENKEADRLVNEVLDQQGKI